jgi:hypothetical protein
VVESTEVRQSTFVDGRGGVSIGPVARAGVRGVRLSDCRFDGVDVAVQIAPDDSGGIVAGVQARNLAMADSSTPFEIALRRSSGGVASADSAVTTLSDLRLTDLVATGADRAGMIDGLESSPIRRLEFRRINIAAQYGITCAWAAEVSFFDARIATDFGPAMIRSNTVNLTLDNWQETTPEPATAPSAVAPTTAPLP